MKLDNIPISKIGEQRKIEVETENKEAELKILRKKVMRVRKVLKSIKSKRSFKKLQLKNKKSSHEARKYQQLKDRSKKEYFKKVYEYYESKSNKKVSRRSTFIMHNVSARLVEIAKEHEVGAIVFESFSPFEGQRGFLTSIVKMTSAIAEEYGIKVVKVRAAQTSRQYYLDNLRLKNKDKVRQIETAYQHGFYYIKNGGGKLAIFKEGNQVRIVHRDFGAAISIGARYFRANLNSLAV